MCIRSINVNVNITYLHKNDSNSYTNNKGPINADIFQNVVNHNKYVVSISFLASDLPNLNYVKIC
jgi:hypothetical protein